VRAWPANSFIDKTCQATSIWHLVDQLLMPLVAGLRVICGSCSGCWAALTEMRYTPAIAHLWMSDDGRDVRSSIFELSHAYMWFNKLTSSGCPIILQRKSSPCPELKWTRLCWPFQNRSAGSLNSSTGMWNWRAGGTRLYRYALWYFLSLYISIYIYISSSNIFVWSSLENASQKKDDCWLISLFFSKWVKG